MTRPGSVYLRLERDSELRARLIQVVGIAPIVYLAGTSLDDAAWQLARIQRRIVEDEQ